MHRPSTASVGRDRSDRVHLARWARPSIVFEPIPPSRRGGGDRYRRIHGRGRTRRVSVDSGFGGTTAGAARACRRARTVVIGRGVAFGEAIGGSGPVCRVDRTVRGGIDVGGGRRRAV